VTTLGNGAFANCANLTSVTINSNAVASDEYTNSSVSTPRNFKSIFGEQVTSYTLGSQVTAIGQYALYGCSGIQRLTVKATTPPTVAAANTFTNVPTNIPVYVPSGTQQSYRNAEHWSRFTNIKGDPAGDIAVSIPYTQNFNSTSNSSLPAGWHSLNGSSYVYNQKLRMSGGGASEVVLLPPVSGANYACIEMKYKRGVSSSYDWEIGYVTDIYDPSTFVSKCTPQWTTSEWNTVVMQLSLPTGARYALRTNNTIEIDDVKIFNAGTMPENNAMVYVEDFSYTGTLPEGWLPLNGRAIKNSGYLKINGTEFVLLPKLTASAQKRRVMEVDVKIINTGNSTPATVEVGYNPGMNIYYYSSTDFQSKAQLECPANATRKKRLYVYTDLNQATRRFAIKTTGNATVQVDDVQVYYTYESPEQNDFICDFSTNPIHTNPVPNAGAYSCLVGQPTGNLYTNHGATNNWKTGTVNGVSDKHAYCDISGTEAVSSWLVMPFVKVTEANRLLSYNIAVTHKNGTQQPVNASQVHSSQFLKVYISEDGYNWTLEKTYSGNTLANIPPTGEEEGYIPLSSYYGKNIKVAFHAGCSAGVDNNYRVHIDNVTHSNYDVYPPYNVQATNVGLTSATISWQYLLPYQSGGYVYVPADGTSAPPAGNTISDVWSTIYNTGFVGTATNVNQLEVTGLLKGKQYTAYVCSGDVSPLTWETCTFATESNLPVPTNLSVEVQGRFAYATWDPRDATEWQYDMKYNGGVYTEEEYTYGTAYKFFSELEPGSYSIRVRSVGNPSGNEYYSSYTDWVNFTITNAPLYPAPAFSLVNIDDVDKLTLAWSNPALPHPAATVKMTVQFSDNSEFYNPETGGASFYDLTETIRQFTTTDYSLINAGQTFYVRLRAKYVFPGNTTEYSYWSGTVTVTMPEPCAAPTNITSETTDVSINLTWEGSADSYQVRYRPEGSTDDYSIVETTENSVSITDFMPHTTYEANLVATCEYGLTSEPVSFVFNNIQFEDDAVKAICVANWDTNGDGELSYAEAANVTDISGIFTFNVEITSFNELQYFTGLTEINANAFEDCTNLASVTLPESITSIENWAFSGCESLTGILIPEGVTNIIVGAFYYSGLESIVIPASVTQIGSEAFSYCTNLQSITVANDNPNYTSNNGCNVIVEKATNKLIAGCAYSYIYEGVETIARRAFIYTGITTLELPSTLQTIGEQAFSGCESLVSIDLPAGLTNIEIFAFSDCTNLAEITCHATTPPTLGTDPFINVDKTIPVYVPCAKRSNYKAATGWSAFTNIDGYDCETILLPIAGYGDDPTTTVGWNLLASPLVDNIQPRGVANMLSNDFDLYWFDGGAEGAEWQNFKNHTFMKLSLGRGFLYANSEDVVLEFRGVPVPGDQFRARAIYNAGTKFGSWDLVGNSFTEQASIQIGEEENPNFYRLEPGTRKLMLAEGSMVEPMEGIFVELEETTYVIFHKSDGFGGRSAASPMMNIELYTREGRLLDRARLRTGEGTNMSKLDLLGDDNRLSLRANGKDCAVVYVNNLGEVPLNLETAENGSYTLHFDNVLACFDYLHLIDNLTGADVDLLATSNYGMVSYTFEAKTTDYASRFRLVFRATENGDDTTGTEGDSFAFIDAAGNIVITADVLGDAGTASLQVIDVMGRVVLSTDVARGVSTNGMTAGVYVLRLINGDDVKVQKIVVD
ncbi:MAG: leucine-rich repeat protein, partial [Bacteroidales bacterium]|nr:leucine-rich repeat protein [Bacteroidales bacterium]